jgi:hypothetical protein
MEARFWWDEKANDVGAAHPAARNVRKLCSPACISRILCIQRWKGMLQQNLRLRRYNSDCAYLLPKLK